MAAMRKMDGGRGGMPWRVVGWGGAALVLLLPFVTNAPWTLFDYVLMAVLLGGAGLAVELAARGSGNLAYRGGVAVAVAAAFLLVCVNGAVGILGNESNPANLMFFGVIAVAALGAVLAGFRPAGMARAMFAAAGAQLLAGMVALAAGLGSPGYHGLYEVAMGTSVFATLWLIAGGLFSKAAGEQAIAS